MAHQLPDSTEVLVVGAGPTGLALATGLRAAGVDHVLVDRLPEGANESRACIVHARTLEVLADLDISRRLIENGVRTPRFTLHDGGKRLGALDFSRLDTPYPYALMVPQDRTEAILLGRLTELGGRVHRPVAVGAVRPGPGLVAVDVTGPDGVARQIEARYVVGADGSHSVVREQAGIGFAGETYPESFVLADCLLTEVPDDEVRLHLSGAGVTVLAPLPGRRHRVVATVGDAGTEPTPEHPDLAYLQRLLADRVPGSVVSDLGWSSRFLVHHRLADRYRAGRLLLAGDAAHVHSPAGGQGMNTGIQDALALATALTAAVQGDDGALDDYETRRRPVAEQVVAFTDRMTRMATLHAKPARKVRDVAVHALLGVPAVRDRLARTAAELDNR